jgi:hypothetical protein
MDRLFKMQPIVGEACDDGNGQVKTGEYKIKKAIEYN